jgi:hypothetical protein
MHATEDTQVTIISTAQTMLFQMSACTVDMPLMEQWLREEPQLQILMEKDSAGLAKKDGQGAQTQLSVSPLVLMDATIVTLITFAQNVISTMATTKSGDQETTATLSVITMHSCF